eukprot:360716-Chlamydomonas_euryale.AAC.2
MEHMHANAQEPCRPGMHRIIISISCDPKRGVPCAAAEAPAHRPGPCRLPLGSPNAPPSPALPRPAPGTARTQPPTAMTTPCSLASSNGRPAPPLRGVAPARSARTARRNESARLQPRRDATPVSLACASGRVAQMGRGAVPVQSTTRVEQALNKLLRGSLDVATSPHFSVVGHGDELPRSANPIPSKTRSSDAGDWASGAAGGGEDGCAVRMSEDAQRQLAKPDMNHACMRSRSAGTFGVALRLSRTAIYVPVYRRPNGYAAGRCDDDGGGAGASASSRDPIKPSVQKGRRKCFSPKESDNARSDLPSHPCQPKVAFGNLVPMTCPLRGQQLHCRPAHPVKPFRGQKCICLGVLLSTKNAYECSYPRPRAHTWAHVHRMPAGILCSWPRGASVLSSCMNWGTVAAAYTCTVGRQLETPVKGSFKLQG